MNSGFSGAVFVVYGQKEKKQTSLQLSLRGSAAVSVLRGGLYSWFGYSVSGAGQLFLLFSV